MEKFQTQDIQLDIDGMGIVMYSPQNMSDIVEGSDYLTAQYSKSEQVAEQFEKVMLLVSVSVRAETIA